MYWYHDKDALWQEALDAHLKPFGRFIRTWCHGDIPPGAEWQQEVSDALTRADIIVPLVSADFLADDLNYERIQQAVERHKRKEVHVVPIILRPCNWQKTVLGSLDVLPAEGTPVTKNGKLDEESLSNVAAILGEYAKNLLCEKQHVHCICEGDALVDDGDYEAALQAYEQALQLRYVKPLHILGKYKHMQGQDRFVLLPYEKPLEVWRKKAKLLFVLKQYKKAWNAYEQLVCSGSAHVADYINLAEVCYRVGYPVDARDVYQSALRLEPKNASLHYYLANCLLYHLRTYEATVAAIAAYEQAIQYDPSHTQWYIEKGHALRHLGHYSEALEAYEAAIQIDAGNALAFTNKGVTLYELKDYESALKAYRQAVFLDSTNAMAYLGMAAALVSLQRSQAASEAFMQAEQLGYSRNFASSISTTFSTIAHEASYMSKHRSFGSERLCINRHKNLPGAVWCEQCEQALDSLA